MEKARVSSWASTTESAVEERGEEVLGLDAPPPLQRTQMVHPLTHIDANLCWRSNGRY